MHATTAQASRQDVQQDLLRQAQDLPGVRDAEELMKRIAPVITVSVPIAQYTYSSGGNAR